MPDTYENSPRPTVIIDSRERQAYAFDPELFQSKQAALETGDYTLEGMESVICIERKSLDDLVQSLIRDRNRFLNSVKRMQNYPFRLLVAECSIKDIAERAYVSNAHPNSVIGAIVSLLVDWRLPVIFAGDRQHALWFTQRLLSYLADSEHFHINDLPTGRQVRRK